jgi:hypothetical protein
VTKRKGDQPPPLHAQQPPAEVALRGACGPRFQHLFVTKLDEDGRPVEYLDVPELLHSNDATAERYAIKVACRRVCAVRSTCLQWAVATRQPHGAWGGKTKRQLTALQKAQDRADAAAALDPAPEQGEIPAAEAVAAPSAA